MLPEIPFFFLEHFSFSPSISSSSLQKNPLRWAGLLSLSPFFQQRKLRSYTNCKFQSRTSNHKPNERERLAGLSSGELIHVQYTEGPVTPFGLRPGLREGDGPPQAPLWLGLC